MSLHHVLPEFRMPSPTFRKGLPPSENPPKQNRKVVCWNLGSGAFLRMFIHLLVGVFTCHHM
jgi:hypothetical protein